MRHPLRLLAAVTLLAASLTACSLQDRICRSGEYPVKAIGNATGRTCVPNDQEPPAGYIRYPDGQVPERVGDEWDEYWSTRIIDENGQVTELN